MIYYITNSKIDRELWDRRISESPEGIVYAYSWYLDIVSPGWDALTNENYEFIFPLTKRKKAGLNYLYQPHFTQQLGIFGQSSNVNEKTIHDFLHAIPHKFKLIEIQLNTANTMALSEDFHVFPRKTHLLDLSDDYEKIRAGYSENQRRNLKKGEQQNPLTNDCTIGEVATLFRNNRGKNIETLKSHEYAVLSRLVKEASKRNLVEIVSIRNETSELISAAVFLKSVHSYIFLFSATSDEGKSKGAMSRIINSFIIRHSKEKMMLDFEGSMDENLARFYKSFGSKEVVYLQIRKNNLPLLIRWLK